MAVPARLTTARSRDVPGSPDDDAGRRTSETPPNGVRAAYGYDAASNLVTVTATAVADDTELQRLTYRYDAIGRRSAIGGPSARIALPRPSSATYDAGERLTAIGATGHSHDADGNRTADASARYTWNARGELTEIAEAATTTTLRYDPRRTAA